MKETHRLSDIEQFPWDSKEATWKIDQVNKPAEFSPYEKVIDSYKLHQEVFILMNKSYCRRLSFIHT